MDIICPKCGEPWDNDSIHENDKELPYDQAYKLFRTQGCGSIFDVRCERVDNDRSMILTELADLMGDDSDGYASMIEDFNL